MYIPTKQTMEQSLLLGSRFLILQQLDYNKGRKEQRSSETSVHTISTRCLNPEDGILQRKKYFLCGPYQDVLSKGQSYFTSAGSRGIAIVRAVIRKHLVTD
jgi:hypothetical protein